MALINMEKLLKKPYVGLTRVLREAIGDRFPRRSGRTIADDKFGLWLRSLLAIHDIDALSRLDLAWWQLDALAEVDRFLAATPDPAVFEYGSGASTIWLARRAASVISIEHDSGWHQLVQERLTACRHVDLRLIEGRRGAGADSAFRSEKANAKGLDFQDYVAAIDAEGPFDLIVIDGRCRAPCLARARSRLKPEGMIVFDNSNRRRYRAALEASDLQRRRFWGMTACLPYPDETTLLRPA